MSIPVEAVPVPPVVQDLADGSTLTPVWRNDLGGVTWFVSGTGPDRYVKWGPRNDETSLAGEGERLAWAKPYTLVPEVLDAGADETHEWLVTRAIRGRSAVDPAWLADPETAVRAVGAGLRALHDALPVDSCPWSWSAESRIADAAERGIVVPDELAAGPAVDQLVVCHGDACVPNTLLGSDGHWVAHVDLGALGVADRWADIAVAAMSTEWNYGPGFEDLLVEAYGVEPDRERMAYYRDLWNAT